MLNLTYKPTYTFASADIFDYSDTQLRFEVPARQSPEWAALCRKWLKDGANDVGRALEIVGMAIIAVSQDEIVEKDGQETQVTHRYEIDGRAGAEALREAIEAGSPGHGDTFIKHLALGHYNLHFRRSEKLLGN